MTQAEIIRMARQIGSVDGDHGVFFFYPEELERFADLVSQAEREACAKIAEEHQHDCYDGDLDWHEARRITAAIRARGEE